MIWERISIDEIKSSKRYSLVGGPFGSDLSGIHYVDFGVPVIRGTNLPFDLQFSSEDFVYVSEEKARKLISNSAYPGDLIFTQRGTLGQVGIVPFGKFGRYIISQSQMKLSLDKSKADPLFVYYYFRTKECVIRIENLALSSGVPHINLGILKGFKIPLPPLPIQHKIASILSSYDELIENNKQRIKLLEEMAEEIYNEWFVRMRFHGYETAKFVDGLPEGWKKVKISDVYITSSGGTPLREKEDYYVDGNINWVKTKELLDTFIFSSEEKINEVGLKNSSAKIFPIGTILIGMYGGVHGEGRKSTLGQLGILTEPAATNQACCAFLPRKKETYSYLYLFYFLKSKRTDYLNMSMGAAQQNISQDIIKNSVYINPNIKVINKFDSIVEPVFTEIKILSQKNLLLQQTRDLLLPRLISGKLSVEHLVNESSESNLSMAAEPEIDYQAKK